MEVFQIGIYGAEVTSVPFLNSKLNTKVTFALEKASKIGLTKY